MAEKNEESKEIELVRIAAARGIFFPSAEIFDSTLSGFWDYGPIGLRILNNVISKWRNLLEEVNAYEIAGAIILPRKVLQASGHEANFSDPLAKCKKCGSVFRIDKMLEENDNSRTFEGLSEEEYAKLIAEHKLKCEKCGGELGKVQKFSLMIGAQIGVSDELNAYLRPEACQSIYLDFKRIFDTYAGRKLPLAIAQMGKAFRNEISPRNNILRQREFYQMDIEVFFANEGEYALEKGDDIEVGLCDEKHPDIEKVTISRALEMKIIDSSVTAYWTAKWIKFIERIGFEPKDIRLRKLHGNEKPFYAKEAFDLEIRRDEGWVEMNGIHHRNDYDMTNYEKFGASVPKIEGKVPNIFEISCGTDRLFYLLLYRALNIQGERHWFSLKKDIAPYEFGIFPLQKDEKLIEKAKSVHSDFKRRGIRCYYAESGGIGKRYAKADEIGVSKCVTIDYTTLEDDTITIRDRDTTEQVRKKFSDVE